MRDIDLYGNSITVNAGKDEFGSCTNGIISVRKRFTPMHIFDSRQ